MLFAFVNSLNWVPTNSFQHGRTKILDPSFSNALHHRHGSLVQSKNAQLVQRAPTHTLQKTILEPSEDSISKEIHTKCFVEAEGPRQRCRKPKLPEDAL